MTRENARQASTLVIGGGVMGTSIALELARRADRDDAPVVLLERGELGAGSSGRSGAILRQHYADRQVAAMARDSLREYGSFRARTGRSIGFRRTGVLTLAGPEQLEWAQRISANVEMLQSIGVETALVDAAEMRRLVPAIEVAEGSVGAWEPGGGFVDPNLTVQAFAALARSHGAATRTGVTAESLIVEEGHVLGAHTSEGVYHADHVIVVAGPWSGSLLATAGVELPLRVLRPENQFFEMPSARREPVEDAPTSHGFDDTDPLERSGALEMPTDRTDAGALHAVLIDLEGGFYARCEPQSQRTRIGHVDYDADAVLEDPDAIGDDVSSELAPRARAALGARMPEYAELEEAGAVAAWYTLTPDAQAAIGPLSSVEALYVVTGFSGHGFKLAPSVGRGVAEMIEGQPVGAFDPEFFAPDRFGASPDWGGRFGL